MSVVRVLVLLVAFCTVAHADTVIVVDGAMSKAKRAMVREATDLQIVTYKRLARGLDDAVKAGADRVIVITDSDAVLGVASAITRANVFASAIGIASMNDRALKTIASAGKGRVYKIEDADALAAAIADEAKIPPPEPVTFAYVFVVDRSSSMSGPNLELAKEATRVGIEVASLADTLAVITFDSDARQWIKPTVATNRVKMSAEVSRIQSGGTSNLKAGLELAVETLKSIKATEIRVVVATWRVNDGALDVAKQIAGPHTTLSVLQTLNADPGELKALAAAGGGEVIAPEKLVKFFLRP